MNIIIKINFSNINYTGFKNLEKNGRLSNKNERIVNK